MVMQGHITRIVKQSFIYSSHAFFWCVKRSTFLHVENQLQTELEVLLV